MIVVSTITYNKSCKFGAYKLVNNYADIFNELPFLFLLYVNVTNTSYAQIIKLNFSVD